MTDTAPATIDYGRDVRSRRRLLRRAAIGLILCVIIAAAWRFAPPVWSQFELCRLQARMMRFTPPAADTVALTTYPVECDRLFAAGGTHALVDVQYIGSGGPYSEKIAGFVPTIADPLYGPDVWGIIERPRGATLSHHEMQGAPLGPSPTLFLHARRAPGRAPRRLVHVTAMLYRDNMPLADTRADVSGYWEGFEQQQRAIGETEVPWIRLSLVSRVLQPAFWRPGSRWTRVEPATTGHSGEIPMPAHVYAAADGRLSLEPVPLRIRAGVADPADDARFTLDYDVAGAAGVIEGRLNANDSVTWTILSGPLRPWPPQRNFWGVIP